MLEGRVQRVAAALCAAAPSHLGHCEWCRFSCLCGCGVHVFVAVVCMSLWL